jgi:hypothetical protein
MNFDCFYELCARQYQKPKIHKNLQYDVSDKNPTICMFLYQTPEVNELFVSEFINNITDIYRLYYLPLL